MLEHDPGRATLYQGTHASLSSFLSSSYPLASPCISLPPSQIYGATRAVAPLFLILLFLVKVVLGKPLPYFTFFVKSTKVQARARLLPHLLCISLTPLTHLPCISLASPLHLLPIPPALGGQ